MLLIPMLLLGIAVALFRRSSHAVIDGPHADTPMRLLRWATDKLSAQRSEWGQAMIGELDHIEGRGRRWRFALGCVGAALLLPPWGRAGAGVLATMAVAIGGLTVYAVVYIRYGLGAWGLVGAALVATFLLSFAVAAIALLRRPGIAVPGLLSGLVVAVAWLGTSGFTFTNLIGRAWPGWAVPLLFLALPGAIGAVGTLLGGSAAAGRRTARLAGISAGLAAYLYGTLAVLAIGGGGPPDDNLTTVSAIVGDRVGNNDIFYLALLPLVTATFGWSAAAATARICHLPDDAGATYAPARSYVASAVVEPTRYDGGAASHGGVAAWSRTTRVGLISAAVAGIAALGVVTGLR